MSSQHFNKTSCYFQHHLLPLCDWWTPCCLHCHI